MPASGEYTIEANGYDYYYYYYYYGYGDATGIYGFSLTTAPTEQTFAISVGDTVSDGVPAAGAGNIETGGAVDNYTFGGAAGETLRFDDTGVFACCTIYWQLFGPDGTELGGDWFGDSSGRQFTLPATGQYTIEVNGYGGSAFTATGTYGFSLTDVPVPQTFAIAVGDSVSNGVPASGAGNIETGGAVDGYTFTGAAGEQVRFVDPGSAACCTIYWQMFAPDGTTIGANWFGDANPAPFTLPSAGTYTIQVNGYPASSFNVSGTYAFSLLPAFLHVPATIVPVADGITSPQDAVWTVTIDNSGATALHGVSATLDAAASGSLPVGFDNALMAGCTSGSPGSDSCNLPDIPAHSTQQLTVFVTTNALTAGTTVTGHIDVSATGEADALGSLAVVTIVSCGFGCTEAVATPGVPVSSTAGPPTAALPTKQVIQLPANVAGQPTQPAVAVTLNSITPSALASPADKILCPVTGTAPRCSGQISVFAGNFVKYVNAVRPIRIQILAKWTSAVPAGHLLMAKDSGGPPIQLAGCVLNAVTHKYNVPCLLSETVSGSAAGHNLVSTDTILFVGTDPHFSRRLISTPNPPTGVTATAGVQRAVVHWVAPTVTNGAITGYVVTPYLGTVALKAVTFAATARSGTITGLGAGKVYTFKVCAKNMHGLSLASVASKAVKVT